MILGFIETMRITIEALFSPKDAKLFKELRKENDDLRFRCLEKYFQLDTLKAEYLPIPFIYQFNKNLKYNCELIKSSTAKMQKQFELMKYSSESFKLDDFPFKSGGNSDAAMSTR